MKYLMIGAGIILAVFLVILIMIPKGIEPLTELYFEEHTELPKLAFLDKAYGFTFTVNNLEYTPMEYEYIINVYDEEENLLFEIERGNINLENNQSITIDSEVSFDEPFERAKVNIELNKITSGDEINSKRLFYWSDPNYPDQINIHFWIEEITGPKIIITPD